MRIHHRHFRDKSFILFEMTRKKEKEALDEWGAPDTDVQFESALQFAERFEESFGFAPQGPFPPGPITAELRLSDGYGSWYVRVPLDHEQFDTMRPLG